MINKDIYIGDTHEQLGCITAADAIIIDGKIVTREDVRRLQSELEAFKSLYSAAKGSADKLNEMLRGAKEERNALVATVEVLRDVLTRISEWPEGAQASIAIQALSLTPQQHLHHIRVETIKQASNHLLFALGEPTDAVIALDKYTERVRDGE